MDTTLKPKKLQHMPVTTEDIENSILLTEPSSEYIWIVLAKQTIMSNNHHLVNIRWSCNSSMDNWTQEDSNKLYKDTIQLVDRKRLHATRRSGSNGTTTCLNYNIL